MIYIDGFAGPGRYSGGEDGSPVVALKALASQTQKLRSAFEFHFVERDRRTAEALNANIDALRELGRISSDTSITVHARQTFEHAYDRALAPRLAQSARVPTFVLVDPFGWTGIPMRIMADLMRRPSTELLINFMFEEINRFLSHKDQPQNFDTLFGCSEWRKADEFTGQSRKNFLHDLYRDQLRNTAGVRYVRSFEMVNDRGTSDYFLFFATQNLQGLRKMKEVMWRVDPAGGVRFSDATNLDQQVLFEPRPDMSLLRRMIGGRFSSMRAPVCDVELFVLEDTPFHGGHYKKVLAEMERTGHVTPVNPPPGRRRGTYSNPAMVLAFAASL